MASNTTLNSGTGGDVIATKERTHDGDATKVQVVTVAGVTGSEGSYTFTDVTAGGGVEATALRVTIASDSTGVLSVDDNGGSLTVDGTVAVTGVSTAANQTTIIGHLDGVEGLLTTIDADTSNLNTAIKTEDAAHSSGDTGFMLLAVRRDADTTLADTTGDYAPLQVNASGSLKVAITAGAGSGGTSIADGATFTRDTTSITPAGAVVETSAPTLTNGDVAGLSMTTGGALRVALSSGGVVGVIEDAASAGGEEGILMMAVRRDTAASSSGTDGDYSTINTDANGRVHVIAALASSQTLATVTTVSTVTNVATIGTSVTPGTSAAHLGKAEDAAHASGDTGVAALAVRRDTAAVGSGTDGDYSTLNVDASGRLWAAAVQSGTWTVQPGNTANTTAWLVSPRPATSGGLTIFRSIDLDETEEEIKATAGQLYGYYFANTNASARYLKFYNATAANVTVGTTTPVLTFYLPPTSAGHIEFSHGIAFATAITAAATTGVADNDTGAPGANEVILNAFYA